MKDFEIQIRVIEEAGHLSAMTGISFNKDQELSVMPPVARKLAPLDFGHNKFLEQIMVWVIVRAPRYWWQEADTFRLSSKSSQSTMHTILKNELTPGNFECRDIDLSTVQGLNEILVAKDLVRLKRFLPEGFMQKRMWMVSYKTLRNIIIQRRHHRLPHWQEFIRQVLAQVKNPELLPSLEENADFREMLNQEHYLGQLTEGNLL
jgi:hypothetical protein